MRSSNRSRRPVARPTASMFDSLERRTLMTVFMPKSDADLQPAIDAAQLGDTIILNPHVTTENPDGIYTGGFILRNKTTGSGWITIQSSDIANLPAPGVRVTPADAPNLAKLRAPGSNVSVVRTNASAHHYKFDGIEFIGPATGSLTGLISFGDDTTAQSTYESVPHHLIIDRSYMRPNTPAQSIRRAIALNSAFTDITNSYIQEMHDQGSDSQAIGGWNGTGPYNIINNHLEGASENIMFGGGTHRIPGYTPSDIVIRGNYVTKPLAWRGVYSVKNLFELKTGRRVLVEGNIFENNWTSGQDGTAIVLKLGNYASSTHLTTEDVVFRNNIVRHSNNAIALQGRDYDGNSPPGLVRKLTFTNNLFYDINNQWAATPGSGIGGNLLYMTHGPQDVVFDHNTFENGRTIVNVDTPQYPVNKFVFTNNIVAHNTYGLFGDGASGQGDPVWTMYFNKVNDRFLKNVIMDNQAKATLYDNTARTGVHAPNLRAVNYWPTSWASVGFVDQAGGDYHLASGGTYKNVGTDGFDPGANIDLINASTSGAISGQWSSSFAYMSGSTLMVQFDGTTAPITLGKSGANVTATRDATTMSFPGVTSIFVTGTLADDVLHLDAPTGVPLTFSNENGAGDSLRVLSGSHTIPADLATPIRNVNVTVDAGATANFGATQHLGSLTVNGNANVTAGGAKVIVTNALAVTGKLDLSDNDLVLDYTGTSPMGVWNGSSYTGVAGLLASGRHEGDHLGNGIATSQSAAQSSLTTLGLAEASDVFGLAGSATELFSNEVVDSTSILIKYTYGGDANLDGQINADDYALISFNDNVPTANHYFNGDFNFDGDINADDFALIDFNRSSQGVLL